MMRRSDYGEKWIKYYSSSHHILLVGEGDFSFSVCLALAFGSAKNIVATTLDSYEGLIKQYKRAQDNLVILHSLGASVLHRVDATQITSHPLLRHEKFHRIIYNFPHAGFYGKEDNPDMISMHRDLVRGFLLNASGMLYMDGEVHVNHKTTAPFDAWGIEHLGTECSLVCFSEDEFRIQDYPGYSNKRGSSERADESFPLGPCKTFRFMPCPAARMPQTCIPQMLPLSRLANYDERASEWSRILGRNVNYIEEKFGGTSYDTRGSVVETLRYGNEMHTRNAEAGRQLSEFSRIPEGVYNLGMSTWERRRQLELVYRHGMA